MSSKVDKAKALEMRTAGATLREIGEEFGVSRERARQILGQEGISPNCRACGKRLPHTRDGRRYCGVKCRPSAQPKRDRCPDCGESKLASAETCKGCYVGRWRQDPVNALIVEMWNAGENTATIAAAVDSTVNTLGVRIHRMRKYGFDLPYRRRVFLNGTPAYPDLEVREWRPAPVLPDALGAKELDARHRTADRRRCWAIFHNALDRGRLTRPSVCGRCGKTDRIEGHHHDYSKPLEVEWLCFACHRSHHIAIGTYGPVAA